MRTPLVPTYVAVPSAAARAIRWIRTLRGVWVRRPLQSTHMSVQITGSSAVSSTAYSANITIYQSSALLALCSGKPSVADAPPTPTNGQ